MSETGRGFHDVLCAIDVFLERHALLIAHGYPELPGVTVPDKIINEINHKRAAIDAAWSTLGENK